MNKYDGRRTFSDPPNKRELDEFSRDIVARLEGLTERRVWNKLDVVRSGTAAVAFGSALPVDTSDGSTVAVALPLADSREDGQELAIFRRSAAGVVTLAPPLGSKLNGSTAVLTLTAAVGYFVAVLDGANYLLQRGP